MFSKLDHRMMRPLRIVCAALLLLTPGSLAWAQTSAEIAVAPAVISGTVAIGGLTVPAEPGLDDAVHGAARMLGPVYDAVGDKFLIAVFFTTETYANAHPDVMRKFAAAIIEAGKWANKNHAADLFSPAVYAQ